MKNLVWPTVHAFTLLLITLFFGRWASLIPMATLAAILVVVSYHMSEWRAFVTELRSPKSDVAVLLTTFFLTVLVDLTVAIGVGMVLTAFLFMRRMASVTSVTSVTDSLEDASDDDGPLLDRRRIPAGVEVYEINGPFFFGAAQRFKDTIGQIAGRPTVLILRMRNVPALDSTGMRTLRDVVHRTRRDGTVVIIAEAQVQPLTALTGSGTIDEIGVANVVPTLDAALARAADAVLR